MERRSILRWVRRVSLRFWPAGEEKGLPGHTVNLSKGGMFVGTNRPPKSGTRVRIEVLEPANSFVVEGVVTHSHNVAPELRRIQEPGMGVRFLHPGELVAALVTSTEDAQATTAPTAAAIPEAPVATAANRAFAVRFDTPERFLDSFSRDIRRGGLFVPSRYPAALDQVITVELHLPIAGRSPEAFQARVVQRIDPREVGADGSQLKTPGMGIEFVERDAAVARLWRVVRELKGSAG